MPVFMSTPALVGWPRASLAKQQVGLIWKLHITDAGEKYMYAVTLVVELLGNKVHLTQV